MMVKERKNALIPVAVSHHQTMVKAAKQRTASTLIMKTDFLEEDLHTIDNSNEFSLQLEVLTLISAFVIGHDLLVSGHHNCNEHVQDHNLREKGGEHKES